MSAVDSDTLRLSDPDTPSGMRRRLQLRNHNGKLNSPWLHLAAQQGVLPQVKIEVIEKGEDVNELDQREWSVHDGVSTAPLESASAPCD